MGGGLGKLRGHFSLSPCVHVCVCALLTYKHKVILHAFNTHRIFQECDYYVHGRRRLSFVLFEILPGFVAHFTSPGTARSPCLSHYRDPLGPSASVAAWFPGRPGRGGGGVPPPRSNVRAPLSCLLCIQLVRSHPKIISL